MIDYAFEAVKQALRSDDEDAIYGAIIDAGKQDYRELEAEIRPYLDHPDAALRQVAVNTLGYYWDVPDLKTRFAQIWRDDEDDGVRGAALYVWADDYQGTANREVLRTLYNIFSDSDKSNHMRYKALLSIIDVIDYTQRTAIDLRKIGYKSLSCDAFDFHHIYLPRAFVNQLMRSAGALEPGEEVDF